MRTGPQDRSERNRPPFWPFGPLTDAQMWERAKMESQMRAGRLAVYPAGL